MEVTNVSKSSAVFQTICQTVSEIAKVELHEVDSKKSFVALGLDSLDVIELIETSSNRLGISLALNVIFDHDSIDKLSSYIDSITAISE
jgi:acyl carrier protein